MSSSDPNWGHISFLSAAQEDCLRDFLAQAPIELLDESKFIPESIEQAACRFLRARSFDVTKSLELLADCHRKKNENSVKERRGMTAEECGRCDMAVLKQWYPHTMRGFDKFNRPLLFENTGGIDASAINHIVSLSSLVNYHWWVMERSLNDRFIASADRALVAGERFNTSVCVVLDFKGLSISHCNNRYLNHIKAIVAIDSTCYPEILGKLFAINVPWLGMLMWETVKHWLDPRTRDKIEIIGSNKTIIRSRLLQFIDEENLPREYGGTGDDLYPDKKERMAEIVTIARGYAVARVIPLSFAPAVLGLPYVASHPNSPTPVTGREEGSRADSPPSPAFGVSPIKPLQLSPLTIDSYVSDGPLEMTVSFLSSQTFIAHAAELLAGGTTNARYYSWQGRANNDILRLGTALHKHTIAPPDSWYPDEPVRYVWHMSEYDADHADGAGEGKGEGEVGLEGDEREEFERCRGGFIPGTSDYYRSPQSATRSTNKTGGNDGNGTSGSDGLGAEAQSVGATGIVGMPKLSTVEEDYSVGGLLEFESSHSQNAITTAAVAGLGPRGSAKEDEENKNPADGGNSDSLLAGVNKRSNNDDAADKNSAGNIIGKLKDRMVKKGEESSSQSPSQSSSSVYAGPALLVVWANRTKSWTNVTLVSSIHA